MATKIWLHPAQSIGRRKAQSALARQLLSMAADGEGIILTEEELNLPGLELIQLFSERYQLGLSIAHCGTMIAIAIASALVGIDCEAKGRGRNWRDIARQFFSSSEARTISAAAPSAREAVFLRHWVLKEAFIKAGRGSIFGDLNSLVLEGEDTARLADTDSNIDWQVWALEIEDCPIAVCSAASGPLMITLVEQLPAAGAGGAMHSLPGELAGRIEIVAASGQLTAQ